MEHAPVQRVGHAVHDERFFSDEGGESTLNSELEP
eukprot:COSAG05_NODE_18722_length_304_cov_0.678049_2_plen_34_part_01